MANGGLLDFARRELQAAAKTDNGNWLPVESAQLYQDAGRYDLAVRNLEAHGPNYFAFDVPSLPRPYWEALFPETVLDGP